MYFSWTHSHTPNTKADIDETSRIGGVNVEEPHVSVDVATTNQVQCSHPLGRFILPQMVILALFSSILTDINGGCYYFIHRRQCLGWLLPPLVVLLCSPGFKL